MTRFRITMQVLLTLLLIVGCMVQVLSGKPYEEAKSSDKYAGFSGVYAPNTALNAEDIANAFLITRNRMVGASGVISRRKAHQGYETYKAFMRQQGKGKLSLLTRDYFDFAIESLLPTFTTVASWNPSIRSHLLKELQSTAAKLKTYATSEALKDTSLDPRVNRTVAVIVCSSSPDEELRHTLFRATYWSIRRYYSHVVAMVPTVRDEIVLRKSGMPFLEIVAFDIPYIKGALVHGTAAHNSVLLWTSLKTIVDRLAGEQATVSKSSSASVSGAASFVANLANNDWRTVQEEEDRAVAMSTGSDAWANFDYLYVTRADAILHQRHTKELFDVLDTHESGSFVLAPHRMLTQPLEKNFPKGLRSLIKAGKMPSLSHVELYSEDIETPAGSCCDDGRFRFARCGSWWFGCTEWGLSNYTTWIKFGENGFPMPAGSYHEARCTYTPNKRKCPLPPDCNISVPILVQNKSIALAYGGDFAATAGGATAAGAAHRTLSTSSNSVGNVPPPIVSYRGSDSSSTTVVVGNPKMGYNLYAVCSEIPHIEINPAYTGINDPILQVIQAHMHPDAEMVHATNFSTAAAAAATPSAATSGFTTGSGPRAKLASMHTKLRAKAAPALRSATTSITPTVSTATGVSTTPRAVAGSGTDSVTATAVTPSISKVPASIHTDFSGVYVPFITYNAEDYAGAYLVTRARIVHAIPKVIRTKPENGDGIFNGIVRQHGKGATTFMTRDYFDFAVESLMTPFTAYFNSITDDMKQYLKMRIQSTTERLQSVVQKTASSPSDWRLNSTVAVLIASSTPDAELRYTLLRAAYWSTRKYYTHVVVMVATQQDAEYLKKSDMSFMEINVFNIPFPTGKALVHSYSKHNSELTGYALKYAVRCISPDRMAADTTSAIRNPEDEIISAAAAAGSKKSANKVSVKGMAPLTAVEQAQRVAAWAHYHYLFIAKADSILHQRSTSALFDVLDTHEIGSFILVPHRMLAMPLAKDIPLSLQPAVKASKIPNFSHVRLMMEEIDEASGSCCDAGRFHFPRCGNWWYTCPGGGLNNYTTWIKFGENGLAIPAGSMHEAKCSYSAEKRLCKLPTDCNSRVPVLADPEGDVFAQMQQQDTAGLTGTSLAASLDRKTASAAVMLETRRGIKKYRKCGEMPIVTINEAHADPTDTIQITELNKRAPPPPPPPAIKPKAKPKPPAVSATQQPPPLPPALKAGEDRATTKGEVQDAFGMVARLDPSFSSTAGAAPKAKSFWNWFF